MRIVAALLHLCLCATAAVSTDGSTETTLKAAPGDIALLPCYTAGNVTPSLTTWMKNEREVVVGGGGRGGPAPAERRLAVLHDGSLNIRGVMPGDEGSYLCNATLPGNHTFQARVLLQVTSGPESVSTSITSTTTLSNGTLYTKKGSLVSFNCSASSYPSQRLTWAFRGASSSNDSLVSASGSWLDFRIENVQPGDQGVYSCRAENTVSHETANKSTELLVYYVPDRHPDCMWAPVSDSTHVQFTCTWHGVYPMPGLRWGDHGLFQVTDSLSMTLNRSLLSDGQTVKCMAQHQLLDPGKEKSCSFTLKPPFPEGEPLTAALVATDVTLSCTEAASTPPANTTWRKGLQQDAIVPGSKYILSVEGPVLKLTIVNVSKDDEGVYFCRSENPLAVSELEVYLTVKTSSAYTGAIIGIFIAALIVGSAVIVAKTIYSNRHRICLGGGFGQLEDDRGDVLSLVESDDEQIFQDAVPQLPPITNGHHTTLVQIHRIPSSDHEEAETADSSAQQQEDTVQTDEPEDLVSF
ncbi:V-set and immunoglobulin domain-containing protein 10 isoform X3 [Parambassis ranga]|uniref:V-set and immunoglobulin domain-containing protein 10 isoform X3 n=1 Tax=Parambassis ranga TaxID=210632 RepID=UPI00104268A9|nr:V-set and immunoglobulin domain-containing protein 10 isoform X3 [Parambassis ranga]